ncbi:uncharacterized protein LOC129004288 isoform X1 [Macrosteles quadrilineatus]|uniref:uncharacterized protein LOC129004288 isoform X1 n=1 Tax=Macrosteles quadrilineatus TaxID=74068 RepID=UPI0023E113A7|nr:uncharacterized protein LOC129004288 isoform X1 [Macrosteles quadrilineatus]
METTSEQLVPDTITPLALQRLWARRLNGSTVHEESDIIAELLEDRDVFPSAQFESDETVSKSRACSPAPTGCFQDAFLFTEQDQNAEVPGLCCLGPVAVCKAEPARVVLDGASLKDIPALYRVPAPALHEQLVVGVWVDPRVTTGYKYRVRPLDQQRGHYMFGGRALALQNIGRGYARRFTFQPDEGKLNDNENYFWSDSRPDGFAFEIEVISLGDKFTVFDANNVAVAILEVVDAKASQEELDHKVLKDGTIQKMVRVRLLVKVEWFEDCGAVVVPMSGTATAIRDKKGGVARVTGVSRVMIGSHPRKGFTLTPGINNKERSTVVHGVSIGDVPTRYTVFGLQPYEMPVIGTYIDPRIMPGFEYRVRMAGPPRKHFFQGRALRLVSVGAGYGKRITFAPDVLNEPENYFWSDTHPDGLGFEIRAVHVGQRFHILAGGLYLGEAHVFRADAAQYEEKQEVIRQKDGTTIVKYVHVDVTCHVKMDTTRAGVPTTCDSHTMRVSGTAVVARRPRQSRADLLRVENIGLDSQLNLLFVIQQAELTFHPVSR